MSNLAKTGIGILSAIAWYFIAFSILNFFGEILFWISGEIGFALFFLLPILFVILGCILIKKQKEKYFWIGFIIPHALFFGWSLLATILMFLIGFEKIMN